MRQPFMTRSGVLPGPFSPCCSPAACRLQLGPGGGGLAAHAAAAREAAVTSGSVAPGQQAEFAAYVDNTGGPVTLVSASLIPIAGHPAGHLAAVAVSQRRGPLGFARGWPPDSPVVPFAGARIGPGDADVVFAMAGPAGHLHGRGPEHRLPLPRHRYTMRAYAASVACVTTRPARPPAAGRRPPGGLAHQKGLEAGRPEAGRPELRPEAGR